MTPDDLHRIETAIAHLPAVAEPFSRSFYDTLFEIAPDTRSLFSNDLTEQRVKLFDELRALVAMGVALADDGAAFTSRANALGRRHVGYGAAPAHYELVGAALLAALAEHVPGWDPADRTAWTRLYGLVAQTMLEGAQLASGDAG